MQFKVFIIALIILRSFSTMGQSETKKDSITLKLAYIAGKNTMKPILVGERIPDIEIEKVLFSSLKRQRFSNFKGKLMILDFWHQWCGYCVEQIPKMEALQEEFKGDLVIMPVTFQSEESVRRFAEQRKEKGEAFRLPSIVEDTLLRKLFPHSGDPFEVWISAEGFVVAITYGEDVNEENIKSALAGRAIVVTRVPRLPQ